jgi:hypothetical protein
VKCPIFSSRATPPNLDVVLQSGDGATDGVESKLTEYLAGTQTAQFADVYKNAVAALLDGALAAGLRTSHRAPEPLPLSERRPAHQARPGLRRCHKARYGVFI